MCISGEALQGMGMGLTGNEDALNGNAHPHREWGCTSLRMHILSRNRDVPDWEWGSASPEIGI